MSLTHVSSAITSTRLIFCCLCLAKRTSLTSDIHTDVDTPKGICYFCQFKHRCCLFIIVCVMMSAAAVQGVFVSLIYERFFEHQIQQFVDLCSISNISIFILESDLYGYYIHGRSVHGRADTGLREMHENFVREEVSLVRIAAHTVAGWI